MNTNETTQHRGTSHAEVIHRFIWKWAEDRGISTDTEGDISTERWLDVLCERKIQKWISVTEKVPQVSEAVIAAWPSRVGMAWIEDAGWGPKWYSSDSFLREPLAVTHWQPLPEAPDPI